MLDTQFNGSTSEIGRNFMKFIGNHHNMVNPFARMKKANAQASVRSSKIMTCPECQALDQTQQQPFCRIKVFLFEVLDSSVSVDRN